jgi:hypothetical protein
VHAAFGTVLWIVCGVGAVIAVLALILSGRTWSELGKGGLVMDRDTPSRAASANERDEEIRAMLAARNARRARRGEQPLDVEAELTRLTTPAPEIDPELAEEVRQLVMARNARRTRAGKPALDVEAEVARELRRVSEGLG